MSSSLVTTSAFCHLNNEPDASGKASFFVRSEVRPRYERPSRGLRRLQLEHDQAIATGPGGPLRHVQGLLRAAPPVAPEQESVHPGESLPGPGDVQEQGALLRELEVGVDELRTGAIAVKQPELWDPSEVEWGDGPVPASSVPLKVTGPMIPLRSPIRGP